MYFKNVNFLPAIVYVYIYMEAYSAKWHNSFTFNFRYVTLSCKPPYMYSS